MARAVELRCGMSWLTALVIGRILAETGSPPPDIDEEALLLIKRRDVVIGCTPGDAGVGDGGMLGDGGKLGDGGALPDASSPADAPGPIGDAAIGDAGVSDAGVSDGGAGDGGTGDGGTPDASTCTMIPGDAITMVVQPHVTTTLDGTRFAVLLVTPQRPILELAGDVFSGLAQKTSPRIEHKTVEVPDSALGTRCASYGGGCGGGGGGGCEGYDTGPYWDPPAIGDAGLGDGGLVEEMIGPYQFVRAQPTSSTELAGWLDQLGFAYMPADLDAVAPYIALGYHVVAIRVAIAHPQSAPMIPIALTYPGSELRVPAALGHGAVSTSKLTVYVAAEGKYQFPTATVRFAMRTGSSDAPYLTRNEIELDQNAPPEFDPIAASVYDQDYQEVQVVTHEVHVPVEVDCSKDDDGGGCCNDCNAKPRTRFDWVTVALTVGYVLWRPRRRRRR